MKFTNIAATTALLCAAGAYCSENTNTEIPAANVNDLAPVPSENSTPAPSNSTPAPAPGPPPAGEDSSQSPKKDDKDKDKDNKDKDKDNKDKDKSSGVWDHIVANKWLYGAGGVVVLAGLGYGAYAMTKKEEL